MSTSLIATLKSYIPDILQRRIVNDATPPNKPFEEKYMAAVLFVDISGFTALTEKFAGQGPSGAEDISAILNDFYGQWIEIIKSYGGDIIKFAGDGLLVIWEDDNLETAALHAAQAALDASEQLAGFRAGQSTLSTRIAISAGEIGLSGLGGVFNRWEVIITGDAIEQVSLAQASLKPGQISVSPAAWKSLYWRALGDPLEDGYMLLKGIKSNVTHEAVKSFDLNEDCIPALRSYIPGAIARRIDAGQSDWLAELRRVTSLFINVPEMTRGTNINSAQKLAQVLQSTIYRYEGSVNKISVDEKGVSVLAVFGLPPFSHEDDPLRGVLTAQDIKNTLTELGINCYIGVTTGRVFCGVIGNEHRREYTITGDAVNLSARLMGACGTGLTLPDGNPITILTDATTYEAAMSRVNFSTHEPINIRGKAQPVAVFVPQTRHAKDMGHIALTTMIGRETERYALAEALRALITKESKIIIIEGEAGLGKSRLIEEAIRQSSAMNIKMLIGLSEAIEQNTPYHVWKNIAATIFEIEAQTEPSEQRLQFEKAIQENQSEAERAPLLNGILPFNLPENDFSKNITGEARASAMHDLILDRLEKIAERNPTVLIIEDAHWQDSGSWALLHLAAQRVKPLLILMTLRPMSMTPPMELTLLRDMPNSRLLTLLPLDNEDIETLLCQRLNVRKLPEQLVTFIRDKAEGHPFYSEELVHTLFDSGLLLVKDNECALAPSVRNLEALNLPGSLEGVITSRFDKMPPSHQLTLKVASVIGRVFALQELSAIYPIHEDIPALPGYLTQLEKEELTILDSPDADTSYLFKHIITQEVAYNLLLFSQRRSLHRSMAEWYEQAFGCEAVTHFPALAYHWKQADVTPKAMEYLEKAGNMALHNGAYREAIQFFTQALEKAENTKNSELPPLRHARWLRSIGEAHMALGQLESARNYFRKAAQILQQPAANSQLAIMAGLAYQLLIQTFHRRFPKIFFGRGKVRDEELQEIAQNYTLLARVNFISSENFPMVYHALKSLNYSELGGSMSASRVWALGSVSAIMSLIPNPALAEHYAQKALAASAQVDNPYSQIWTQLAVGAYKLGIGAWDSSRQALETALELSRRSADRYLEGNSTVIMAGLEYARGKDFKQAEEHHQQVYALMQGSGNNLYFTWAVYGLALINLIYGQFEEALKATQNEDAFDGASINLTHLYTIKAMAYWQTGREKEAFQYCARSLPILTSLPPQLYSMLIGERLAAQIAFEAWEQKKFLDVTGFRNELELKKTIAAIMRLLKKFKGIFPFGEPPFLLYRGWQKWMEGKYEAARKDWQISADVSRRLSMPRDEANALRELGRRSEGEVRRQYLQNALELFVSCHAKYGAAETKKLLG